jgi:hypothetical protein
MEPDEKDCFWIGLVDVEDASKLELEDDEQLAHGQGHP